MTLCLLHMPPFCRYPMATGLFLRGLVTGVSPVIGAMSAVYAATQPNLPGGRYISPTYIAFFPTNLNFTKARQPVHPAARNPDNWWRLYDATIDIVRKDTGDKVPSLPAVPIL